MTLTGKGRDTGDADLAGPSREAGRPRRLLPDYRFDPRTGLWRHAAGPSRPRITLAEVRYGPDGEMDYPRRRSQVGEEVFPGYLRQARAILAARPAHLGEGATGLPTELEALRWFPLPPACLQSRCAE